jgi:hypothetical protein
MITSEYILELSNVFHSGQVEAGTCLQKMIGTVRTGVILKDVSLEVHGGELSAVLGSKGTVDRWECTPGQSQNFASPLSTSGTKSSVFEEEPVKGSKMLYK